MFVMEVGVFRAAVATVVAAFALVIAAAVPQSAHAALGISSAGALWVALEVAKTVENVEASTGTLSANREEAARILRETASLTKRLNDSAPKLDSALTSADLLFKSLDSVRVNRILASTETFTASLERSPRRLGH